MKTSTNKFNLLNMNEFPTPTPTLEAIPAPPWSELPLDVTANILQRLGAVEILQSADKVCASWWNLCHDSTMWRVIKIVREDWDDEREYTMMCRRAVDRSQGQLIDLTIDNFSNSGLLHYIADRSSELRRLTLARCSFIISIAATGAIKKLLKLEELHLIQIEYVNIEAIGISCPMLKSFTFDQRQYKHPLPEYAEEDEVVETVDTSNEHALAIAKSMPNLCRLRLFANELNNEGLQAILDGCPRLESLDLRQCFGVDLGGALGGRCREQIKDLRLPSDSVDDYEYDFLHSDEFSDVSDCPYSPDFDYESDYSLI